MGVIKSFKTRAKAHAAAIAHRWPTKGMKLILVDGQDGGLATIMALASMLQHQGHKVGVLTVRFVEISGERANGSDKADVLGDPYRLQALLAQMRRAKCEFVVAEVPQELPEHQFTGLVPYMLVMRRCGDRHLGEASNTARKGTWRRLMALHPQYVVINRDDPCFEPITGLREANSLSFGTNEKAECHISSVQIHPKGSAISLVVDHQTELELTTFMTGKTAIYSVVAAAAAGYLLQLPIAAIEEGAARIENRLGGIMYLPIQRPYNVVLASAVTPDGIDEAIETLKHFAKNRLIAVVSGNLAQRQEWRAIIGEIVAKRADRLLVTDGDYTPEESPQVVRQHFLDGVMAANADARTEEIADRTAALEKALSIARRGDTIVVLASIQRPYRQLGTERHPWSDEKQLGELLDG